MSFPIRLRGELSGSGWKVARPVGTGFTPRRRRRNCTTSWRSGPPLPPGGSGAQRPPAELGVTALPSPERVMGHSLRYRYATFQPIGDECDAAHNMSNAERQERHGYELMSSVRLASASPRSWSRAPGAWQSPVMDFAAVVRSRRMVRSYQPGRAV